VAFTQEWRLALAMSSILIPITAAGATMQKFMIKHQTASLGAIAKAGTIAEEVISSIRTAQAFGAQKPLAYLFDTHIAKAVKVGSNGANVHAAGLAAMFFVIYSGYALAFFFGGRLVSGSIRDGARANASPDQPKRH
jgi:ATP-binding cassette subfamily B (MDR/TAP) protein 1